MLETVKKLISSPYIKYEQFFQNYVMKMQDEAIENEVAFLLRNNFPSANSMIKLINKEVGELDANG